MLLLAPLLPGLVLTALLVMMMLVGRRLQVIVLQGMLVLVQGRQLPPVRQPEVMHQQLQEQGQPVAVAMPQSWPCAAGAPPG
jgi:hypothetical protein